uniref:Uncharacterized protein n=1 Tax=Meloidogyne enterolobii TaxID=390850 RepID=A0A6V7TP44_MELEN|nr:unnamed protein product [Meloidogyne enterolobii]
MIEEGIINCCNNKWSNCCRERLKDDKHLICLGLKNELAIKMGICLEKYFYGNNSIIERRGSTNIFNFKLIFKNK